MSKKVTKFVDVILPVAVPNLYTYRVPFDWNDEVEVGKRVIVQFGKKKLYSSIIALVHEQAPTVYQAKYIEAILDDYPVVIQSQLNLWNWISKYYMCTIGEVMNAALPAGLKLVSETKVLLNEGTINIDALSDKEYLIVEALQVQGVLELNEIAKILDIKTVYPIIKSLLDKEIILMAEQVKEKYKPKLASYLSLPLAIRSDEDFKLTFEKLARAPKQSDAFMLFLQKIDGAFDRELIKSVLVKEFPDVAAGINQLIKKEVLIEDKRPINRLEEFDGKVKPLHILSESQEKAYQDCKEGFENKKPVLLHGVTGSGKTEVYVQLITEQLAKGKQVLFLLPEIALTTQIINRLRAFFGDKVGVYHSKFNANERVEVWKDLLKKNDNRYQIIIGARSAIFLPFAKLGLIIVDEEHDSSFKQHDPAPRYHARDTALYMANKYKADVLMGSATPAIETYYNAKQGKFHLVELTKRFGGVKLPEILCSDLQRAHKRKEMKSHFSDYLLEHVKSYLENGEQVMLFQNRRGYNPLWACETCGWTPQCSNCDVSMTYHKHIHSLKCHYCGFTSKPYASCQACGDHKLKMVGFGTEKIEEDLALFFPDKVIKRMDLDTTRSKNGYQNIINDFQHGLIDILVGTQMITKGLDFDNVGMVGVLSADSLLHFPDFRSFERSYQLLTQVSGRAGRKKKRGNVIIQTFTPDHWVIQKVIQNDYLGMYQQEIIERRNFKYPPFYRLIKITIKHRERDVSLNGAKVLVNVLKIKLGSRVLGPDAPFISRIKNKYIHQIIIKFEKGSSPAKVKDYIDASIVSVKNKKVYKSLVIAADVDFQ